MEEAGASLTKDLDEFADKLTDLGRDANAMVQGATDIADAVNGLKSGMYVGQLGTEDVANDVSDAAEDVANDASDAAEDAADSVKDAAKHSIEDLQGAVAKAQEEAEQAAKDVQECTEDVESCWSKAVDKMQADAALAKVKAQLWEAKAKKAAEDAVKPMQECTGDVEACAKKAQDDAAQAAQDIEDAATQTGTDVQVCASDVKDCFEKAKAQADDDFTKTSSDLQKCAASASECFSCLTESDPAACVSALPAPGAKLELGTEQDVEDIWGDAQRAFEDAKANAVAASEDWQACATNVSACATDAEAKAKAKLEANKAMAEAKVKMMQAAVTNGVASGMDEFSECTSSTDEFEACANKKIEEAHAKVEAAKNDIDACIANSQTCITKANDPSSVLGCDDKADDSDLMAKTSADLEADIAQFKSDAEAARKELQDCVGDVSVCGEKMKAKMTANAKMLQAKAALMAKQVQENTAESSEHFQNCVDDVDAVKACIEADLKNAQDESEASWEKLQSCTASTEAFQSCFSEIGSGVTDTFSLGEGDGDVLAQTQAAVADANAKFESCVGDVVACGEKMQDKLKADADALEAKANLMEKQMQEDATANSAYFEHCVGDVETVKECVTKSVEDAKDEAEAAGAKAQECAVNVSDCFEEMRNNIQGDISLGDVEDIIANPPRSSLGCEAEQAAFDAAQSEAQEAAQKVQTSCNGQSDSQECLTSLVEAAKADAAAASAKVALLTEQAKDSTSGVTDDMVAKSQDMADEIQAKDVRCSENPSWETCKPEDPLLGGSITDDIKECFSDIPECWNKLVGKMKKDAEDAEEKAEEAGDKAKEAAEKAKDDASAATAETAKKAQEEADTLKAKADEMAKDAEECAKDPQTCFQKLKKQ